MGPSTPITLVRSLRSAGRASGVCSSYGEDTAISHVSYGELHGRSGSVSTGTRSGSACAGAVGGVPFPGPVAPGEANALDSGAATVVPEVSVAPSEAAAAGLIAGSTEAESDIGPRSTASSTASRSLSSAAARPRYQSVPQMRCSRQPSPASTSSRSRSRSLAVLDEWYIAPSHSIPSA